jgi:glycerophosphoryl diester phosphodiesterase
MSRIPLPAEFVTAPLAHRGFHDNANRRPENSLGAFRAAIEAGYGIELDVQLTSDGHAMVFHDETLDRLTDRTGRVDAFSAADLGAIVLHGSNERIPTLGQVLSLVSERVPLLIEIKDQLDTMRPGTGRLEAAVAAALMTYQGPVAVMSFNPHCVAEMARIAPAVARGLTTDDYDPAQYAPISKAVCDALRGIPDYDRTQSSFISHKAADLSRARVAELKAQGAVILCWTIRSAEAEAKARQIADNITFEGYAATLNA